MQTQKVAITRADGGVSIMSFVVEGRGDALPSGAVWFGGGNWVREPNDENIQSEVAKSVPDHVSWRRITDAEIPADRTYRDALADDGKALSHDMAKAREIQREQLRHERAGIFPSLDADWMKAVGQGKADEAAAIEATRQALRDAPADPRIEAARTTDDLKTVVLP